MEGAGYRGTGSDNQGILRRRRDLTGAFSLRGRGRGDDPGIVQGPGQLWRRLHLDRGHLPNFFFARETWKGTLGGGGAVRFPPFFSVEIGWW